MAVSGSISITPTRTSVTAVPVPMAPEASRKAAIAAAATTVPSVNSESTASSASWLTRSSAIVSVRSRSDSNARSSP